MKIILTEDQLKLVKLINENVEYVERVKEGIKNLKEDCNKLYSVLTFTTIAELRDNDTDIEIIKQKFDVLKNKKDALDRKSFDFQQRNMDYNGDWINPKAEKDFDDMDMMLYNLVPKIDALETIIDGLISVSELELHNPFKDVKPINV